MEGNNGYTDPSTNQNYNVTPENNNGEKNNGNKTRLIIIIISAVAIFIAAISILIFSIPTFKLINIKEMFGSLGNFSGKLGGANEASNSPVFTLPSDGVEEKSKETKEAIINNEGTINKTEEKKEETTPEKATTKCNSGYVYVSDDNRCYSNSDYKDQINRCGAGEVDLNGDCGTKVDDALCDGSNEDYTDINGVCVEKATLHTKSMECPSGYEILFGLYDGKEFNGACYKYMKPNY